MKPSTTKRFDVLGLGCTTVDDFLYVASYPSVEQKVRVRRSMRRTGGLTGAALIAAARLGARCAYAGCLGTDELSEYVAADLAREGVDTSYAPRLPEADVIHSTVVVSEDTGSRTILFKFSGMVGSHPSLPSDEVIRDTKMLFIDHYAMEGDLRAAAIARRAGVAVVADFENEVSSLFPQVLGLVDHLILSKAFALRITRKSTPAEAARALWQANRAAVVVTCGEQGCWSISAVDGPEPRHRPAFAVTTRDTTGCGDVFHGAYAAALARGSSLAERLRFAAAAAALKAANAETPRLAAVEQFLKSKK